MNNFSKSLDRLIGYAKTYLMLSSRDETLVRNRIMSELGLSYYNGSGKARKNSVALGELLNELGEALISEGLFSKEEIPQVNDKIMGILLPLPSVIEKKFNRLEKESPEKATDFLYNIGISAGYIKKEALDKNPRFSEGRLSLSINKTKPEYSDPKKALKGSAVKGGYPACTICRENEGNSLSLKSTLRTIGLKLGQEDWFWQFSPYGYFNQHGIAVNQKHTPMKINASTVSKLLDFIDRFPHYFIGCNAALPRIGGSVLAHDHFQGGKEVLPIHSAPLLKEFHCKDYPNAKIGIIDWPISSLRIKSNDRGVIEKLGARLIESWLGYENKAIGIIPSDESGQHNSLSPIVRKEGSSYLLTIVFRSNYANLEYPDGVFVARPEYQIIKKESVGLIEAQGLFILPGRLDEELKLLAKLLASGSELPEEMKGYSYIYNELKEIKPAALSEDEAYKRVKKEAGSVCERILENNSVFKNEKDFSAFLLQSGLVE
ncbi:MAG: galactose-1-phosphate uridylyltransferase [Clostridia bacterium]|nr:galactose-1-phosphate uridylyltransferase [Clostridia bacterium]